MQYNILIPAQLDSPKFCTSLCHTSKGPPLIRLQRGYHMCSMSARFIWIRTTHTTSTLPVLYCTVLYCSVLYHIVMYWYVVSQSQIPAKIVGSWPKLHGSLPKLHGSLPELQLPSWSAPNQSADPDTTQHRKPCAGHSVAHGGQFSV